LPDSQKQQTKTGCLVSFFRQQLSQSYPLFYFSGSSAFVLQLPAYFTLDARPERHERASAEYSITLHLVNLWYRFYREKRSRSYRQVHGA